MPVVSADTKAQLALIKANPPAEVAADSKEKESKEGKAKEEKKAVSDEKTVVDEKSAASSTPVAKDPSLEQNNRLKALLSGDVAQLQPSGMHNSHTCICDERLLSVVLYCSVVAATL